MPDETKLNSAIDAYASSAIGGPDDEGELSRQRGLSIDYYAGKNMEPAPKGRSQVVDRTLLETIQWILPSLSRIFAGGDNIVEFDPVGPDDEDGAEQQSDILNHKVMRPLEEWDLTVRTWNQDALLTKNAYCLVEMEEKLEPEKEQYEGLTEEQLTLLLDDDVEVTGQDSRVDPDQQGPMLDPITGEPIENPLQMQLAAEVYASEGIEPQYAPVFVWDIEIKRTKATKNLNFQVLPPERCRIGKDTTDFTLKDCNYFEYADLEFISELRKAGYDIPDDQSDDGLQESIEDEARDQFLELDSLNVDTPDKSMRQILVRHIWIRHDYDEDGVAELQYVMRIGNDIINRQEIANIPVACIVPFINTHRHMGMSITDLVADIQRIKQKMMRAYLDSLEFALNSGHAVSDKVNIDDILVNRPGRVVRLRDGAIPGEGHVMPLVAADVSQPAQAGLEYMDRVVEARVGVNKMFQGIDSSNLNDYNRVGQLSSMAAQRVEEIAKIMGIGYKRLFTLAHELIIKAGYQKETIRLRGEWVDVDPTAWRTGRDMKVTAPYAAGNKDALLQRLLVVANIHEKALAAGLPIVDASDAYELALEISKAADLTGTKFFTDPATVPPPEPQPDHTLLAIQVEDKKVEQKAVDDERDATLDKYKADQDALVKQEIARLNSETQIALANIKAGNSIDLEQVRDSLRRNLEGDKGTLGQAFEATTAINEAVSDSIREITDALAEMKATAAAPIKVVRKGGKIVGKEVNGVFTPLEDSG